jgi:hypothetical protein
MAAPGSRPRNTLKVAAVLFLPAACVLAVWYANHERPAEARRANELAPSQIGAGFAPQAGFSTPIVDGGKRPVGTAFPESVERAAEHDVLQARMKTEQR